MGTNIHTREIAVGMAITMRAKRAMSMDMARAVAGIITAKKATNTATAMARTSIRTPKGTAIITKMTARRMSTATKAVAAMGAMESIRTAQIATTHMRKSMRTAITRTRKNAIPTARAATATRIRTCTARIAGTPIPSGARLCRQRAKTPS